MKKQMKRLLLGAAFVGMLALAGCGGDALEPAGNTLKDKSAEGYVQAAQEALAEADSFTADFKTTVQMKGSGKTVTEGTVTSVKDPFYVNVDTDMIFDDLVQEYDLYLEKAGDEVNQYMSFDGEWTEMTMDKTSALAGVKIYNTLENMQTFLDAGEDWKMQQKGGNVLLTGIIPEEKVYAVEEEGRLFQQAGMSGLSEVYFAGVGDVTVELAVDAKTGAPISFEIDLAKTLEIMTNNVLTELGGGTLENPVKVTRYVISSEITKLGDVEAGEIPVEAKSSAINYDKEISLLENEEK